MNPGSWTIAKVYSAQASCGLIKLQQQKGDEAILTTTQRLLLGRQGSLTKKQAVKSGEATFYPLFNERRRYGVDS